MIVQDDLWGTAEAAEDAKDAWVEQLRGPLAPCPWSTQGGRKQGEMIETFRCPRCGGLEMSDYLLFINHSTSKAEPGRVGCRRVEPFSGMGVVV